VVSKGARTAAGGGGAGVTGEDWGVSSGVGVRGDAVTGPGASAAGTAASNVATGGGAADGREV